MKKLLIALAIGGAIFGTVFAFAASLGLSANDLAAGDQVVAACSGSNVGTVTYTTGYSATAGGYVVNSVVVSGLGAGCNGESASATLTGSTGTTCPTTASGTTSIGAGSNATVSGGSVTIPVTPTPLACNVAHIYVVVSGTSTPIAIARIEPAALGS